MEERKRRVFEEVDYDPTRSETRKRIDGPLTFEEERNVDLRNANPADAPWWKRLIEGGLQGFLQAGVGGAIGGGLYSVADKHSLGRVQKQRDVAESDAWLKTLREQDAMQLNRRDKVSQIDLRDAQRSDLTDPNSPKRLRESRAQRAAQLNELKTLLKLHPHPFDLNNDTDRVLLAKAEMAGGRVPEDWGIDSKAPRTLQYLDDDGVTVRTIQWDTAARDWRPVTLDGAPITAKRVQRVDPVTGQTANQIAANEDRDRAFGQRVEEFQFRMSNGLSGQAKNAFDVETRGDWESLRAIDNDLDSWRRKDAEGMYRAGVADGEIAKLEARRNEIQTRINASREKALKAMGGSSSGSASSSTTPAATGGRVSRSTFGQFRKQNPAHASKSDAEIEALLRSKGYEVY